MADFLSRLAARTLGVAPTVQPRIAPLYAPEPRPVEPLAQQHLALLAVEETGPVQHVSGQQAPASFSQDGDEHPLEQPQATSASTQLSAPMPQQAPIYQEQVAPRVSWHATPPPDQSPSVSSRGAKEEQRALHPQSSYLLGEPFSQSRDAVPLLVEEQTPRSVAVTWQPLIPPIEELPHREAAPPARTPLLPSPASRQTAHQGASAAAPPPWPLRSLSEKQGAPLPLPVMVPSLRAQERDAQRAPAPAEALSEQRAPAQTIHVTIGRVEVQAAPPPVPRAQPARSGPPVMGLEEYLSQRAKGGR